MIDKIKSDMQEVMSSFRYEHSLRVADEAQRLARSYNLDGNAAYMIGLLHDNAKEISFLESKAVIEKYNLPLEWLNKENENILHALVGAYIARDKYDLNEEEFLAIKYHAIGNENMSFFAKIIFIADKVARNNLDSELEYIRIIAYINIDEAMERLLLYQQKRLEKRGLSLHKDTNKLLKKLKSENEKKFFVCFR